MKADGNPFKMVLERSFDARSENIIPINMTAVRSNADKNDANTPEAEARKNIEMTAIIDGNRPLHGTKELVSIAISLSRGESIILHPVTPAALHPKPIHIVRACFPQAEQLLKHLSRLNAIRGR